MKKYITFVFGLVLSIIVTVIGVAVLLLPFGGLCFLLGSIFVIGGVFGACVAYDITLSKNPIF